MKRQKYIDKYLINFFMQCNSLRDLLDILESICTIQNLNNLKKRIKQFEYLRFTFFGLIGRVKTLIGYILFKAESLKEKYYEINIIYPDLQKIEKKVFEVDELIKRKEIIKSSEKIIEVSKEYEKIFQKINKLIENYLK